MNRFQILALGVVACLFIFTIVALVKRSASRREGLAWALLWIAAAVAIAWPNVTTIVAHALGIRQGADLVLYSAVVIMMIGFLMVYVRLRRLQRDITLIVRHLALREAVIASSDAPPTTAQTADQ